MSPEEKINNKTWSVTRTRYSDIHYVKRKVK